MKKIASSVVVLGAVLLSVSSCFLDVPPSETAKIRLVFEKGTSDEITDTPGFDCYAVNVIGPGIKSADPRFPISSSTKLADSTVSCHYPGIGTPLIQPGPSDTEAYINVAVPVGKPRLVQLVGIRLASGQTHCPQINFSALWKQKIDAATNVSEVDNDAIFEIGRAIVDLPVGTREKDIAITANNTTNSSLQLGKTHCDPPGTGTGGGLSASDPQLWLWLSGDKYDQSSNKWSASKSASPELSNVPASPAGAVTFSASGGPKGTPVAHLNLGNLGTDFSLPSAETFTDTAIFFVVNPSANSELLCLAPDLAGCAVPSSVAKNFFSVAYGLPTSGELSVTACLGCVTAPSVPPIVQKLTGPTGFVIIGTRLTGTLFRTSIDDGLNTYNHEQSASGNLNFMPSGNAFRIGDQGNIAQGDVAELIVYRASTGSLDPTTPCQYINSKYGSHVNCNFLLNGP